MKRLQINKLLLFILIFMSTKPAWAYLDPGSVSLFIQGILAALAAGFATFRLWWDKVKSLFRRKRKDNEVVYEQEKSIKNDEK